MIGIYDINVILIVIYIQLKKSEKNVRARKKLYFAQSCVNTTVI